MNSDQYWFVVIVGLLYLNGAFSDSTAESKLETFLYSRCRKYAPNAATYDEVRGLMGDFTSYLRYTANLIPEGKKQFCYDEKPKLEKSAQVLARTAEPCFPKTEKFLPDMLKNSFIEFLNFLCYQNGQNIDNFFSTQGKECLQNISQRNGSQLITSCFDLKIKSERLVTKEDFCSDLNEAQNCFDSALQRHCQGFTGFQFLNAKFFRSIRKPCNGSSSLSSGITTTFIVTIAASFFTRLLF